MDEGRWSVLKAGDSVAGAQRKSEQEGLQTPHRGIRSEWRHSGPECSVLLAKFGNTAKGVKYPEPCMRKPTRVPLLSQAKHYAPAAPAANVKSP